MEIHCGNESQMLRHHSDGFGSHATRWGMWKRQQFHVNKTQNMICHGQYLSKNEIHWGMKRTPLATLNI